MMPTRETSAPIRDARWRRIARGLAPPLLLWSLFFLVLFYLLQARGQGDQYDEAALEEWIEEARGFRETLPEMVKTYLDATDPIQGQPDLLRELREKIQEQLQSLCDPTKMYQGQLPLFPAIYRLELEFRTGSEPELGPIVWESGIPRPGHTSQVRRLDHPLLGPKDTRAVLHFEYQLHAYNKRQRDEQAANRRLMWVGGLAVSATALALLWVFLAQRQERDREQQRTLTQQQIDQAERLLLQGEVRRQEAEHRHEEAERRLLEQRLATQAAEGRALELKSQLYASIGIMAGSYAHNIKNLLVRPNDLLRRCLEGDRLGSDQKSMLQEVRLTLGTVTERLQQILQTVRRDPSRSELTRIDLNRVVEDIQRTWGDLAWEKWKLTLTSELAPEPLWIEGDVSHLQQAVENLVFNARDATFEMRNHLREEAREGRKDGKREKDKVKATAPHPHPPPPVGGGQGGGGDSEDEEEDVRQALIAAAGWKGHAIMRTRRLGVQAILEVQDNGIGMNEEVRWRCTETHFSTKRNNAIHEGNTTGMGLGLSFVVVILEHHRAELEIESAPFQGALFRALFPLSGK